uniref:(northern house mosquito) hypothetical protein n=1 Tax=Culex pipiens TaxID=7175 RepID=A0A8D8BBK6_CULPI
MVCFARVGAVVMHYVHVLLSTKTATIYHRGGRKIILTKLAAVAGACRWPGRRRRRRAIASVAEPQFIAYVVEVVVPIKLVRTVDAAVVEVHAVPPELGRTRRGRGKPQSLVGVPLPQGKGLNLFALLVVGELALKRNDFILELQHPVHDLVHLGAHRVDGLFHLFRFLQQPEVRLVDGPGAFLDQGLHAVHQGFLPHAGHLADFTDHVGDDAGRVVTLRVIGRRGTLQAAAAAEAVAAVVTHVAYDWLTIGAQTANAVSTVAKAPVRSMLQSFHLHFGFMQITADFFVGFVQFANLFEQYQHQVVVVVGIAIAVVGVGAGTVVAR